MLVAVEPLPARRPLAPRTLERALEVRRVPERFLPPGVISSLAQLGGRRLLTPIPPGGYVLASQLDSGGAAQGNVRGALDPGTRPVEIAVAAASPAASSRRRHRVDVVVTTEGSPGGAPGRTYVAARAVELLELRAAEQGASADPAAPAATGWVATLALRRAQALRLIQAESFARSVRLLER